MKPRIFHRSDCTHAEGLCVVIDVLRAFTTAAFAFEAGAEEIILATTPKEALKKYRTDNSLILMGEEEGKNISGFHYGNSPAEMQDASISGRRLVQRTSSGTQGVFACINAKQMLLASFVVAESTLRLIKKLNIKNVSFIVTGYANGDEDLALAEYLQERLIGRKLSVEPFLARVRKSQAAKRMLSWDPSEYPHAQKDLDLALDVNRFPFAMQVFKQDGELISRKVLMTPAT